MAIIYLTKGFKTVVDDDLYEDLNSYLWYASGLEGRPARRLRAGPRKIILIYHQILHVLPWVLKEQGMCIDHLDSNPLNNQLSNLRLCSNKDNMRNTSRHLFREGIGYDSTHDRYKVYIDRPDKPRINIGTYLDRKTAELALANAKMELGLENN